MAMGVFGKNEHYRWDTIRLEHFWKTAARCGLKEGVDAVFDDVLGRTPEVVEAISRRLPDGFPPAVSEPILEGLLRTARGASGG